MKQAAQEVIDALNARDADRAALFDNSKQDDIIRMAREADLISQYDETSPWVEDHPITEYVKRFAAIVAAAAKAEEREECAAICDRFQARDVGMQPAECAAAIRARSNT